MNKLYYGDNLDILQNEIADESVDLIYLDPPFNSNATYNVLFKSPEGKESPAQIEAFDDTWHWTEVAEDAYWQVLHSENTDAAQLLESMRKFLGENDMMAYLAMMAVRLLELHRVLKKTGSLYLHCDPTASHYLKILLDSVFGARNFQNEIVWRRYDRPKGSQHKPRRYGRSTDIILYFSKTNDRVFNSEAIRVPLTDEEIEKRFVHTDQNGRYMSGPLLRSDSMGARPNLVYEFEGYIPGPAGWRMSKEKLQAVYDRGDFYFTSNGVPRRKFRPTDEPGSSIDNLWDDVAALGAHDQERLGYPTQKPEALLERIISASSNEGDVVLDPFCGCGTTVHAAQKLNRKWVGIDVTHLAISLIERRLRDAFGTDAKFEVHGVPRSFDAAKNLAERDKHEFEKWAISLIPDAQPFRGGKKGADTGIDGIVYLKTGKSKTDKAIVEIKGGGVSVDQIHKLKSVIEREKAITGLFVTLKPPTKPMVKEAASAGFAETQWGRVSKIQILTIEGLLNFSEVPRLPGADPIGFRKAKRESKDEGQGKLDL